MLTSLPDRPLTPTEAVSTSHSRDEFLLFPATPKSMFEDDELTDIRDLMVVTQSVLAVLVYEDAGGWKSVAQFDDTAKFKEAVMAVVNYRGYELSEEDIEIMISEYHDLYEEEFE